MEAAQIETERASLVEAGRRARRSKDAAGMIVAGERLERLGAFSEAWPLLADAPLLPPRSLLRRLLALRDPPSRPEWRGEPLSGKRLLVRQRIRHMGAVLRMARLLADAAATGAEVTAAVESRLVPLFARSFGGLTIVDQDGEAGRRGAFDLEASWERLGCHFARTETTIADGFRPLLPEAERTAAFRRRYGEDDTPVIGIAWHSVNARKRLPDLTTWSDFIAARPARWVSLQYREDEAGIATLAERSGRPVIDSGDFDQIADLDGFAAQVASVDLVLTISNTTAHMAGALGVPCVVLLDDVDHLIWPIAGDRTPFYPHLRLVRQHGRSWPAVLSQAYDRAASLSDDIAAHAKR